MKHENISIDSVVGNSDKHSVTINLEFPNIGAHYISGCLVDVWINRFKYTGISLSDFFDSIYVLNIINFDAFYNKVSSSRIDRDIYEFLKEYNEVKSTYNIPLGKIYKYDIE